MGHRNVEIPGSDVGWSEAALPLDSCIPTQDLLTAIPAGTISEHGPQLWREDVKARQQATGVAEQLSSLDGHIASIGLERLAETQNKPANTALKNPDIIAWRSLMLVQ